MATAVLEIELEADVSSWDVDPRYPQAMALVRYSGIPIERVTVPVHSGRIMRTGLIERMGLHARSRLNALQASAYLAVDLVAGSDDATKDLSCTIAICTRDRPDDVARCLEGVMALPDDGQEVLVIDNCPSSDATRDVVMSFKGVRYMREMRPGLNHARNCALANATGEIIAFIDDDAVPDRDWLRSHRRNYASDLVMAVTGLTMPLELDHEVQEWFEEYSTFSRGFEKKVLRPTVFSPLSAGQIGAGANMSVRRSLAGTVGGFDNCLDAGTVTQSGGDHEMFVRIMSRGYRIIYEPCAINWHRHRRTFAELEATIHGYGVGVYAFLTKELIVSREFGALKVAWSWFYHTQMRALVKALLRRGPGWRRTLVFAEMKGCLKGPQAYFSAVRKLKARGSPRYD